MRSVKSSIGSEAVSVLNGLIESMLRVTVETFQTQSSTVRRSWDKLRATILENTVDTLLYRGRILLQGIQDIMCACLLMLDAVHGRGVTERIIAERWTFTRFHLQAQGVDVERNVNQEHKLDRLIFDSGSANSSVTLESKL